MLKKPVASFWMNAMFYTLLQRVSLFVFGVVAYMLLVRGFSTQTNGVWALYITLFSLFEAVKQGLLRNSTIKFLGMSQYSEKKDIVQSSSLLLNLMVSCITILVIIIFGKLISGWLHTPDLLPLLLWSMIMILLLIPFNHCEIILQARFRFDALFRSAFIRQGTFFSGLLILYFFFRDHFTLLNVLVIQVLALAAATIYILKPTAKDLICKYSYDRKLTIQLFNFGKYTFGTNLFSGLSRNFDHFVTANVLDPLQGKNYVAWYHTVARINNMVDIPSLAAADVLYPKNVEAVEKKGLTKVKYYFEQLTGTILAFIIPLSLFIFLFPRFIIYVVAGPDYYPAVLILQLTILFSMVRPISYQFGSTLDAIGKPHINFRTNVLLMVFNLGLCYIFISLYGGIGAAYASIISYTLSFIVMMLLLKKYVDIEVKNIFVATWNSYRKVFDYVFSRK